MKIIHLLKGKADPNTMNGVNKVVHYLATYGTKAGLDVEVWGLASTPVIRHEHDYPLRLFQPFKPRFWPRSQLRRAVAVLPDDAILHLHSVFLPELFAVTRLLQRRGIPWVLTPHGGYARRSMAKNAALKRAYMALFERHVIDGARALHAITPDEAARLAQLAPCAHIAVIPNGQEIPPTLPVPEKSSGARPVFVFCGRLDQNHKGLDLLLDGFAAYRRTDGTGALWIIGDGPDATRLKSQTAALEIIDAVRFFGPLFGEEKQVHLHAADVFVHTSRWEGMPLAPLEAASLALPLLISNETGLERAVHEFDCGFVLPVNTPDAITKALHDAEYALDAKTLDAKADSARRMVLERFGWAEIMHAHHKNLYHFGEQYEAS